MPKARKERTAKLTRTRKLGLVRKEALVNKIRECVERFPNIIVFQTHNMRATFLKSLRAKYESHARFFFGRNKLMARALGLSAEDEAGPGLHEMSPSLVGSCGIVFTDLPVSELVEFLGNYREADFPRAGFVATETIELPAGPLPDAFTVPMDSYLRNTLLMPTEVKDGKLGLVHELRVCTKGQKMSAEGARICKLLGNKMASFHFVVTASAEKKKNGEYKIQQYCSTEEAALDDGEKMQEEEGDEDDEEGEGEDEGMDE